MLAQVSWLANSQTSKKLQIQNKFPLVLINDKTSTKKPTTKQDAQLQRDQLQSENTPNLTSADPTQISLLLSVVKRVPTVGSITGVYVLLAANHSCIFLNGLLGSGVSWKTSLIRKSPGSKKRAPNFPAFAVFILIVWQNIFRKHYL